MTGIGATKPAEGFRSAVQARSVLRRGWVASGPLVIRQTETKRRAVRAQPRFRALSAQAILRRLASDLIGEDVIRLTYVPA